LNRRERQASIRGVTESRATDVAEPSPIEAEILRGSLKSRCRQAPAAFVAMILNTAFCVLLLGRGIDGRVLAAWLVVLTGLLLIRYSIAVRAMRILDRPDVPLNRFDRQFRALSLASQTATGAGIWIVGVTRDDISTYTMTLLVLFYAVGTMINLAHDYRSFRLTIPFLMVQPILFWLLHGPSGIVISVMLAGLTVLMISSVRASQRVFDETIRIRFEKDELLRQLEREKETALRAQETAEVANRSKSFFMAAASHDLRQPLYAATILCDTLALHSLPPDATKIVLQQRKALNTASGLFDNLLDLSRFESGTIEPRRVPVNLRELFRELEQEFAPQCAAKELALKVEPPEAVVMSDYDLLDRLLRNLVSNAVRYTPEGGEVRVHARVGSEELEIIVEDTGIGIAAADQERVFKEFVQLHNPQRSRDRGVGLGLAIVRHIAVLLGHRLAIESEPGRGTRISIFLGLTRRKPRERVQSARPAPLDLTGREGWVIDDDVGVREAVAAYLSECGCECAVLENRDDLMARLDAAKTLPDFIILDDMLANGASGLEIARSLIGRIDKERILLVTGNVDPQRWRELQASGIAVLRKPVSGNTLNEWLAAAISNQADLARL
jgi:signal transduction histidine kinase/CheY-like chemotaxis protein